MKKLTCLCDGGGQAEVQRLEQQAVAKARRKSLNKTTVR